MKGGKWSGFQSQVQGFQEVFRVNNKKMMDSTLSYHWSISDFNYWMHIIYANLDIIVNNSDITPRLFAQDYFIQFIFLGCSVGILTSGTVLSDQN